MLGKLVKNPPAMQETPVRSLGQEDPLEKVMATHSSGWVDSYLRNPMDRGAWRATVHGGCKELGMTEQLSTQTQHSQR